MLQTAAQVSLHCLLGCTIGEVSGLLIGVWLQLGAFPTMALAVVLSYISGFTLATVPLMFQQQISLGRAFKIVWLGEVVSIAVMELAMNAVDYWVGGVKVMSLGNPTFWWGMLAAIPAGFLAAWPVNYWLLKREIKAPCH